MRSHNSVLFSFKISHKVNVLNAAGVNSELTRLQD